MNNPKQSRRFQRSYNTHWNQKEVASKSSTELLPEEFKYPITVYEKETVWNRIANFFKRIWHKFFWSKTPPIFFGGVLVVLKKFLVLLKVIHFYSKFCLNKPSTLKLRV